ncbi:hypothetical protein [Entomohabitans teleogrylli]|uniref:hypothetical protein n=1 Tax=Entomohabitans teleogrylli TaxID=1384589 RepID=UPI0012B69B18|nr:hypothetical protein [Entomohabitans teleogrylli]
MSGVVVNGGFMRFSINRKSDYSKVFEPVKEKVVSAEFVAHLSVQQMESVEKIVCPALAGLYLHHL